MNWGRYKMVQMKNFVNRMNSDSEYYDENIELIRNPEIPAEYSEIRSDIKKAYDVCKEKIATRSYFAHSQQYGMDLEMAGTFMSILNRNGFTVRDASDDEIWLYINRFIIPDIIMDRFPYYTKDGRAGLNPDRFYANRRRYYGKMLWWYLYLSWQDTGEGFDADLVATVKLLRYNQSDDISQIVERSGREGYPIVVYNEIITHYSGMMKQDMVPGNLLSRVLHLNIARMQITEPELMSGGVSEYVSQLFQEVSK